MGTNGYAAKRRSRQGWTPSVPYPSGILQRAAGTLLGRDLHRTSHDALNALSEPNSPLRLSSPPRLSLFARESILKLITRKYLCQNQLCAAENPPTVNCNPSFT